MTEGTKYLTQSVERALDILGILAENKEGMGVTELAKGLSLGKSTVHRLLSTLKFKNFVQQDSSTEKYAVGWKILQMKSALSRYVHLEMEAVPFLEELVRKCNETAHLAILDKNTSEVVYIKSIEADKMIRARAAIPGERLSAHSTALGKTLLAFLPSQEFRKIMRNRKLERFTRYTIVSFKKLEKELNKIRNQQFAIDDRERDEESRCIAAPVRDSSGEVIAAISISGSVQSIANRKIPNLAGIVKKTAEKISRKLGYSKS